MKHILWILLALIALTGCSSKVAPLNTSPLPPSKESWEERQKRLMHIQSWQVSGKIAAQSAHDSGSATVNWTQRQGLYTISLSGPLGSHHLELKGQPGSVTLLTAEGKSLSAQSPEQLLISQWGFHIPISNIKYWIRGLPVPGVPVNTRFDNQARLSSLTQQGWQVDFLDYTQVGQIQLPNRISIVSPSLKIKIVIHQWHVNS